MTWYVMDTDRYSDTIYKYTDAGVQDGSGSLSHSSYQISYCMTGHGPRVYVAERSSGANCRITSLNAATLDEVTPESFDATLIPADMAVLGSTLWLMSSAGVLSAYSLVTKAWTNVSYDPFPAATSGYVGLAVTATHFWMFTDGDTVHAVHLTGDDAGTPDSAKDFALAGTFGSVSGATTVGAKFYVHDTSDDQIKSLAIPS